jgi:hypothetical protein
VVRYNFPNPEPERWMTAFDSAVARIDDQGEHDHTGRAAEMGDAMRAVLAVSLLARSEPDASWAGNRLDDFRTHVREVLRTHREALAAWLGTLDLALWRRSRDGWYEASMDRSAAEVLVREVDDDAERPLIAPHRLAEVDQEMREIGPTLNALPPDAVSSLIPQDHWWWLLPQGPDQSDLDEADFAY